MKTPGLQVAGIVIVLSGVGLSLSSTPSIPWLGAALAEVFWDQPQMPAAVVAYDRFMLGLLGGVIAGWGATLAAVAREAPPLAWRSLAIGTVAWFGLDTSASLYHGAWPNAVFNTLVFLAVGTLLVGTRPGGAPCPPSNAHTP